MGADNCSNQCVCVQRPTKYCTFIAHDLVYVCHTLVHVHFMIVSLKSKYKKEKKRLSLFLHEIQINVMTICNKLQ